MNQILLLIGIIVILLLLYYYCYIIIVILLRPKSTELTHMNLNINPKLLQDILKKDYNNMIIYILLILFVYELVDI